MANWANKWVTLAAVLQCSLTYSNAANAAIDKVANYTIRASLEPTSHVVSGHVTITWTNPSQVPANEIYLHAYLNAFRNSHTRFMRDRLATHRSQTKLGAAGSLNIACVLARELSNLDLWPTRDPHSPGDPLDDTDIRLPLPRDILPGEQLTLDIDFTAQLPALVERAGYVGSFHAITQWFPKLARRTVLGENRHYAYASLAEFSADFGDYDVTLDVPDRFIVAAPGQHSTRTLHNGRSVEHYRLQDAHDFAWFAWDKFVLETTQVGDVIVEHFAAPSQSANRARTFETLRYALPRFSQAFAPYPFETLVVVHPPDAAFGAAGMEYPGLIVTGGPWYLAASPFRAIESLTLHEVAHQWFYGLVASDEYLHPVLDEGLAAFIEAWSLRERYGYGSAVDLSWLQISEAVLRRSQARRFSRRGPLCRPAVKFADFPTLAGQVYSRTATLLETLSNLYGTNRVIAAIGSYAQTYRFLHPEPEDFLAVISNKLGSVAAEALRTSFFSDGWVDYALVKLESHRRSPDTANDGNSSTYRSTTQFDNQILVERRGTLDFPVDIEAVLEDGQIVRRRLDTVPRSLWLRFRTTSPVIVVTLDPAHLITIDDNPDNQTLRSNKAPAPQRFIALVYRMLSTLLNWVFA